MRWGTRGVLLHEVVTARVVPVPLLQRHGELSGLERFCLSRFREGSARPVVPCLLSDTRLGLEGMGKEQQPSLKSCDSAYCSC